MPEQIERPYSQDSPLKTALFTYNDGRQRGFARIQTLVQLPLPVPGWQLTISDTQVYFIPAANVRELEVRVETQQQASTLESKS